MEPTHEGSRSNDGQAWIPREHGHGRGYTRWTIAAVLDSREFLQSVSSSSRADLHLPSHPNRSLVRIQRIQSSTHEQINNLPPHPTPLLIDHETEPSLDARVVPLVALLVEDPGHRRSQDLVPSRNRPLDPRFVVREEGGHRRHRGGKRKRKESSGEKVSVGERRAEAKRAERERAGDVHRLGSGCRAGVATSMLFFLCRPTIVRERSSQAGMQLGVRIYSYRDTRLAGTDRRACIELSSPSSEAPLRRPSLSTISPQRTPTRHDQAISTSPCRLKKSLRSSYVRRSLRTSQSTPSAATGQCLSLHALPDTPSSLTPLPQLGTSNFGPTPLYTHHTIASQSALLSTFHAHGQRRIDTARVYGITDEYGQGGTERVLKEAGVTGEEGEEKGWVVDTKVSEMRGQEVGDGPVRAHLFREQIMMGNLGGTKIRESLEASLKDLGVEKVSRSRLSTAGSTCRKRS